MSEMAYRKGGKLVTIGTGATLNKLRFEDRMHVTRHANSLDPATQLNLSWRLPVPDEDEIPIGEYQEFDSCIKYNREGGLTDLHPDCCLHPAVETALKWYTNPSIDNRYNFQTAHTITIPCYHLLTQYPNYVRHLCEKRDHPVSALFLSYVKNLEDELIIIIRCFFCQQLWRIPFEEIQPYILSAVMRKRLYALCSGYWEEKHPEERYPYPYIEELSPDLTYTIY